MSSFKEWLVAGETIREVYEGSLWAMALEDAKSRLLEFYNASVRGDTNLILETEKEEEDDGSPAVLDDPFNGDENAEPVEVAPEEPEQEPEPEVRRKKEPTGPKTSNVEIARTIQQMAWRIRWGAMIERAGLVDSVKRIYEGEWLPLMKEREGQVKEEYRRESERGGSEEDIRRRVSEKLSIPILEVAGLIARLRNEWGVLNEEDDDWGDMPDLDSNESDFDERAKEIINRAKPLLLKLGYVDEGELDHGSEREKQAAANKAMAAASAETGNDTPDNQTTQELRKRPSMAAEAQNKLWQTMYDKFMGLASNSYRKLSREMPIGKDGERKIGSQYFQDATEILSDVVSKLIGSLSERKVNQDLSAPAWESDLVFMNADPEKDPDAIIGSLGVRFRPQNVIRDVVRQDNKASAQAPGSSERAKRLSQGAMGDDGVQSSIDPEDTRTKDSLSTATASEAAGKMIEAFKQAMKDLGKSNPIHATIACLWFNLDCAPDGTPAENNVHELMSAAGGQTMSSRITPDQFINKLGLETHVQDKVRGRSGMAGWKLVELIVKKNLPRTGNLKLRPEGNMPSVLPTYTMVRNNPESISQEQMKWWNFYNTVNDAKDKALIFISRRMNEIMVDQSDDLAVGQESAHSWSLAKFLKASYRDQIGSRHAFVDSRRDGPTEEATIHFYSTDRKKVVRSFRLTSNGIKVSVAQTNPPGFESNVFNFSMPEASPGQPMDSRGLMRMEFKLKERLDKTQRKK